MTEQNPVTCIGNYKLSDTRCHTGFGIIDLVGIKTSKQYRAFMLPGSMGVVAEEVSQGRFVWILEIPLKEKGASVWETLYVPIAQADVSFLNWELSPEFKLLQSAFYQSLRYVCFVG